jgi:hypothetical protein
MVEVFVSLLLSTGFKMVQSLSSSVHNNSEQVEFKDWTQSLLSVARVINFKYKYMYM